MGQFHTHVRAGTHTHLFQNKFLKGILIVWYNTITVRLNWVFIISTQVALLDNKKWNKGHSAHIYP